MMDPIKWEEGVELAPIFSTCPDVIQYFTEVRMEKSEGGLTTDKDNASSRSETHLRISGVTILSLKTTIDILKKSGLNFNLWK